MLLRASCFPIVKSKPDGLEEKDGFITHGKPGRSTSVAFCMCMFVCMCLPQFVCMPRSWSSSTPGTGDCSEVCLLVFWWIKRKMAANRNRLKKSDTFPHKTRLDSRVRFSVRLSKSKKANIRRLQREEGI